MDFAMDFEILHGQGRKKGKKPVGLEIHSKIDDQNPRQAPVKHVA